VTEPLDLAAFERALYEWLTKSIDSADPIVPRAIFAKQNIHQPDYPYAAISYGTFRKEGGSDDVIVSEDLTQPAGEEIETRHARPHLVNVSIGFYVDADTLAAKGPNFSAMAYAMSASASLGLAAVLQHFRDASIAVVRELSVVDVSGVVGGNWLGRASLDVQLRVTAQIAKRTGYIDKVQLVSEDYDVDVVLDSTEE
jgi:hypothetical protein